MKIGFTGTTFRPIKDRKRIVSIAKAARCN